jgi:hypothetical protein
MRERCPSSCSCCSRPATTCASRWVVGGCRRRRRQQRRALPMRGQRSGQAQGRRAPGHRRSAGCAGGAQLQCRTGSWGTGSSRASVQRPAARGAPPTPFAPPPSPAGRVGAGQHCRRLPQVPGPGAEPERAAAPAGAAEGQHQNQHAAQCHLDAQQLLPRQAAPELRHGGWLLAAAPGGRHAGGAGSGEAADAGGCWLPHQGCEASMRLRPPTPLGLTPACPTPSALCRRARPCPPWPA